MAVRAPAHFTRNAPRNSFLTTDSRFHFVQILVDCMFLCCWFAMRHIFAAVCSSSHSDVWHVFASVGQLRVIGMAMGRTSYAADCRTSIVCGRFRGIAGCGAPVFLFPSTHQDNVSDIVLLSHYFNYRILTRKAQVKFCQSVGFNVPTLA